MNKKYKLKLVYLLISIMYKMILEYVYCEIVSVYWDYWFPIQETKAIDIFICWFFIILTFLGLDFKKNTVSNFTVNFLWYLSFVPGCVIIEYTLPAIEYRVLFYAYWILLLLFNMKIQYIKLSISTNKQERGLGKYILFSFCCIIIVVWLVYTGGRVSLGLDDVYVARMQARNYDMPVILAYLFSFARSVVPVAIIVNLCQTKYVESFFLTIVGIMIYLFDGSKASLFFVFAAWICFVSFRLIKRKNLWLWILIGFNGISAISMLLIKLGNNIRLSSYFFQRMLFLPEWINIGYYNFFKLAKKDFFRQSIIGKLSGLESPYNVSITRMLGEYIFGNIQTNANTGLMGDAYSNLGSLGILVMPILIVLLLRIIDLCVKNSKLELYVFMGIYLTITIKSVSFFTMFLSNGLIIIGLYLLYSKRYVISNISLRKE